MKNIILSCIGLLFFIGCSGSDDSVSTTTVVDTNITQTDTNTTTVLTVSGVLLDSFINGANYTCGATSAITHSEGNFTCPINTTLTFKIGGVHLGSITLDDSQSFLQVTPATLYGLPNNDISDIRLLNFIQYVQSLDSDNTPSNGINITSTLRDALFESSLDLSDSQTSQSDLSTSLEIAGQSLISVNDALTHYINTLENTLNIFLGDDPYFSQQWYIEHNATFYTQNGINNDAHIHPENFLNTYTGKGVKIAVIDDGLDASHEDIASAIINTFDVLTKSTVVAHTNQDDLHGTSVTGILGARHNAKGIRGIASQSDIIFIKYKEIMTDSETIELFTKAEEFGADIINNSWGTGDVSDAVKEKIIDLSNNGRNGKGTIIVFASGNTNEDIANDESAINEVISVGSSNKNNVRSSYSNFGTNLDVLAPGGEFLGITTLDPSGSAGVASIDENYLLYNDSNSFVGTSASAPVVSGVIALLLEKSPELTRLEVEDILKTSTDRIGNRRYRNGRNNFDGYGKINLSKIMQK